MLRYSPTRFSLEWLSFALAALLLIAQIGAQHHAYSHTSADKSGPELQAPVSHCDVCLSFAPVLSGGGALSWHFLVPWQTEFHVTLPVRIPPLALSIDRAFRARAPPAV